ncbi:GNAT family N-acetyltransferase [Nocardioides antri]|uniref:GNAT family N-acetyltransferase n=2 Tax=Nocardioides antri TaxID=2607659 RepID=A0A5B1M5P9_9ACTN|nr:GNAT family N-acetyltransferase [Nocardioides antri]
MADAHAVYELYAAQQQHDLGQVEIDEEDIVAEWQRPSYDVPACTVGVFDADGRIVGDAEYLRHERYDAAVHPDFRGRGIGTWLAAWVRATAARAGERIIGMPVPEGSAGDKLLEALGYHVRWTSWVLRLPPGRTIEERPLPAGYALRVATEADQEQVWHTIEDAFLEWSKREKQPFEDFLAEVWGRPGFEQWNVQVVAGPDGAVVGAVFAVNSDPGQGLETFVSRVAVNREHRNLGLAQALLAAAFAAGRERGARTGSLSTDSRTGALSLYEKVGMEPSSVWLHRAIKLG